MSLYEERRFGCEPTWVVAFPTRKDRICSRKNKDEAEKLLALCQSHADLPKQELKVLCKKKPNVPPFEKSSWHPFSVEF